MRMLISSLEDFKMQKSRIHETVEARRGHLCVFLPTFHCEYNWIELYWCLAKWHTRGRADMTWKALKRAIWEAFGVIPYDNPTGKALPTRDEDVAGSPRVKLPCVCRIRSNEVLVVCRPSLCS